MQSEGPAYCVYILSNYDKTVFYTGVTNDFEQRIFEHYIDRGKTASFTSRYFVYFLLYYECYDHIEDAIQREKEIKGWKREKKLALIKDFNPEFKFLNWELFDRWPPEGMIHRREQRKEG